MAERIQFQYYYGNEAEQYSFFKIPKLLMTHSYFRELSNDAKILYGLLLDRMSLSKKNKWFDEENRAYIVYSIEEITENLNCSRGKAIKSLQELDCEKGIGLIEKRRLGQGNNTVIYVKNFMINEDISSQQSNAEEKTVHSRKTDCIRGGKPTVSETENCPSEGRKTDCQKSKKRTSRSTKFRLLEVQNLDPNNTNINNNNINNTDLNNNNIINSHRIVSKVNDDVTDRYDNRCEENYNNQNAEAYADVVRDNIDLDVMLESNPADRDVIMGIYDLIVETLVGSSEKILIASEWYPASLVKSKFIKLNDMHVQYVIDMLKSNTSKIRNIKKYILAALFNAPNTMSSYFQAEVNHDYPAYAAKGKF